MTQDTSRKRFLSKVLGMAAVGVLAPRVAATAVLARDAATSARKTAFRIQPQERAVARRDGAA